MKKDRKLSKKQMIRYAKMLAKKYEVPDDLIDWESAIGKEENWQENKAEVLKLIRGLSNSVKKEEDVYQEDEQIELEKQAQEQIEKEILSHIEGEPTFDNLSFVIDEIKNFTYLGECYTFSTLFSFTNGISCLNYGDVGTGKSRSTVELAETLNLPKTVVISGVFTPRGFFKLLNRYNGWHIIFDEGDLLLSDRRIFYMIKSLLTTKEVVWETDKGEEKINNFTGNIILNCNEHKFNRGIEDKIFVNSNIYTSDEIKEKIRQGRTYKPNSKVWDKIRERIIFSRNNSFELTKEEVEFVYSYIENIPFISSFRVKHRVFETFKSLKALFGKLSPEVIKLGKELSKQYVSNGYSELIKLIGDGISKKDLIKEIMNYKDCSQRTAYRIIDKEISKGFIKDIENKIIPTF